MIGLDPHCLAQGTFCIAEERHGNSTRAAANPSANQDRQPEATLKQMARGCESFGHFVVGGISRGGDNQDVALPLQLEPVDAPLTGDIERVCQPQNAAEHKNQAFHVSGHPGKSFLPGAGK